MRSSARRTLRSPGRGVGVKLGAALAAAGVLWLSGTALPAAFQEAASPYTDAARVDSLRATISSDRLEEMRGRAARESGPERWYDLGAALLLTGDWEGAIEPLQRVVSAEESEVTRSASYNLGVAFGTGARPAAADGAGRNGGNGGNGAGAAGRSSDGPSTETRRASLLRARDAFRRVLRANPEADDARWNLEVIQRWLEQVGGGGGGEAGDGGEGGQSAAGQRPETMTPEQVQRLLEAAASEERRVQQERFEDSRARDPVAERNW